MYISEEQLRPHLSYAELIPAIRLALMDYTAGRIQQPLRTILQVPLEAGVGWFATMPVVHGEYMAVKTVTFYPTNAARGLPTHLAIVELLDRATGEPLAVMDGRLITEMRTAAVSAVALEALKPPAATTLGILGAGVQARSHIEAFAHIWPSLAEIRIAGRSPANVNKLIAELAPNHPSINFRAETHEKAAAADVVLVATSSPTPVLEGRWLQPHALVLSCGATGPTVHELDSETMLTSTVIAESRQSVERESGDVILSGAKVHAELGEILSGAVPAPRNQRVLFKSVGMAIEDLTAARIAWEALNKK
jgi:thiomorpholine-carboxylate dehydrogenase